MEKWQKSVKIFFFKTQKIVLRHCHKEAAYQISLSCDKYFLSYEELKKTMFFYEKMAKNGENRFFSKTQKIVPRHYHKKAAYQISLRYDQ